MTSPASVRPRPLYPGATIGVLSVSAPEPVTGRDFFDRGLQVLKDRGHDVILAEHTRRHVGYRTADEASLAADLHQLFASDDVDAIICAGGGVNANRLLRHLDWETFREHPKPLVGVSNPTVLLNAITHHTGLITFHGPSVIWDLGAPDGAPAVTEESLWTLLETNDDSHEVALPEGVTWLRPGELSGRLVAGNLTSLQGLLGTPHEPDWDGAILAWEDIAKPVNRLDMILTHFRDTGVFDRISGMIVGQLVSCEPNDGVTAEDMLLDLLDDFDIPILTGLPFGHTPQKVTLPIGATLTASPTGNALRFDLPS